MSLWWCCLEPAKNSKVSLLLFSFPKKQCEMENKIISLNKTVQNSLNKEAGEAHVGLMLLLTPAQQEMSVNTDPTTTSIAPFLINLSHQQRGLAP